MILAGHGKEVPSGLRAEWVRCKTALSRNTGINPEAQGSGFFYARPVVRAADPKDNISSRFKAPRACAALRVAPGTLLPLERK